MKSFLSTLVIAGGVFTLPQVASAQSIFVDTVNDDLGDCGIPGQCTLKAALRQSEFTPEVDTIILKNARYVLEIADPVGVDPAGAVIRDDVIISGDAGGGTVIEAVGLDRAIDIVADANVVLSDLTIERSEQAVRCEGDNDGALAIVNSKFIKNRQAVETYACSLWVSNADFQSNGDTAAIDFERPGLWENPFGNSPAGAAIYTVDSGMLLVNETTFTGNFAAEGGAIFSDNTDIDISGGSFAHNFAYAGGAIGVAGTAITVGNTPPLDVTIRDTEFQHNEAAYRGGAIHSLVRTDIEEVVFSNNRVITNLAPNTGSIAGGGAVFSWTVDIRESQFINNYVQAAPRQDFAQTFGIAPEQADNQGITWVYLGGAVGLETIDAFLDPGHEDERDSHLQETIFVGNYIDLGDDEPVGNNIFAGGGAVAGNINSLFISNEKGALLDVDQSIVAQNYVEGFAREATSFGGGIALSHGEITDTLSIQNESFAGGGLACWNCEEVRVTGSTFYSNSAERASAIFSHWVDRWENEPANLAPVPVRVENSTFTKNVAERNVIAQRSLPVRANLKIEPTIRFSSFVGNDTNKANLFGFTPAKLLADIFQDNKVGACDLMAISEGFNVFDKEDPCVDEHPNDLLATYPEAGPLSTFNGGSTPTHAITKLSPAVGFVPQQLCPELDQRGVDRPDVASCDAGSFEHWNL